MGRSHVLGLEISEFGNGGVAVDQLPPTVEGQHAADPRRAKVAILEGAPLREIVEQQVPGSGVVALQQRSQVAVDRFNGATVDLVERRVGVGQQAFTFQGQRGPGPQSRHAFVR